MVKEYWRETHELLRYAGVLDARFSRLALRIYFEWLDAQGAFAIEIDQLINWVEDLRIPCNSLEVIDWIARTPVLDHVGSNLCFNETAIAGSKERFWNLIHGLVRPRAMGVSRDAIACLTSLREANEWCVKIIGYSQKQGWDATPVFWNSDIEPASNALGSFATSCTLMAFYSSVSIAKIPNNEKCIELVQGFLGRFIQTHFLSLTDLSGAIAIRGRADDDYVGCESSPSYFNGEFTCPTTNSAGQAISVIRSFKLPDWKLKRDLVSQFLISQRLESGFWPIYRFSDPALNEPSVVSTCLVIRGGCSQHDDSAAALTGSALELSKSVEHAIDILLGYAEMNSLVDSLCQPVPFESVTVDVLDATAWVIAAVSWSRKNERFERRFDRLFTLWHEAASQLWPTDELAIARFRIRAPFWDRYDSGDFSWELSRTMLWGHAVGRYLVSRDCNHKLEPCAEMLRRSIAALSHLESRGQWFDLPKVKEGSKLAMAQNCWLGCELLGDYISLTDKVIRNVSTQR